jgi:DNA-binding MarR family transcriptional regulator
MEVEGIFERYDAEDLLALHTCIRDSRELRQGPDVIPIDVSPQLREGSFAGIPQLRPLGDVLIQFEGIRLHPLHTEGKGGFLDVLERAQQQLDGLEEEEERTLPEWYMVARLFESWHDFIRRELSEEETRARLVVKPVTRWFPNNVGLGDVHVAWVLHNEGPSSAEIDHITLYLGERELECDAKGEMLLPGDQRRVAFRLSKLADSELPVDLDLALAVSVTDEWERRTERVCYPHHGFEVLKAFRGRVIGQEIVRLLQSNAPLTSDELRQYCLEAKMCVHCNQLALLQLLEYSGGYPLFVHILLHGLVRYLKDDERWKPGQPRYVTCTDVPEVVEHVVGRDLTNFPGLIAEAWTTFPSDERAVIEALLECTQRHGGEPASLAQIQMYLGVERPAASILERLEAKGIVEKKDERYKLRARLLEEWLQARRERDRASQSA